MITNYLKNKIYRFLRLAQKYTGTDNVYLAKGGFWLSSSQIFSMAIAFFSAVAFANLLNPATYGNYKYILSLAEILEITSLAGVGAAVTQAVARNLEGSFYSGFKTKLKWGLIGSLAAMIAVIYYWLRGNETLSLPLIVAAVFLPILNASHIYTAFLGGRKLFNYQVKYTIVSQIISVGAIIAALFLTKNLLWLIIVYFTSNSFTNFFFYFLTKFKFRPNKKEDPQTISYGKHLSLMGVVSGIASRLDKLLLFNSIGAAPLAIYSFATIIPEQIERILGNVESLAFPKLASKSEKYIRVNLMQKFWKLSILTGMAMVVSIAIIPFFYKIFFPRYLDSIIYSQAFVLTFVSIPISLLGTTFKAKMMKKELYLIKVGSFIKICLMAILIPIYGIWGAIVAAIGAEIFKSGLVLFLFFRKFKDGPASF
ncbi:MAG: oligosaccharide flippase family protein [Candidatus Nealsonbacteria bacterium]|nr:oligosaccharide flippase family protein [Candidatus Nealsonbacteria bacterium]